MLPCYQRKLKRYNNFDYVATHTSTYVTSAVITVNRHVVIAIDINFGKVKYYLKVNY